jgi:hypothetical protein
MCTDPLPYILYPVLHSCTLYSDVIHELMLFGFCFFWSHPLGIAAALVPSEYNRSESCVRLESPPNGDLNCLSWTWGQMCRPSCSVGHVFFRPLPSAVYLCGRDRRWKPGTSVPDCARKYLASALCDERIES